MGRPASWPWRLLKGLGAWVVGLVILFEEWGWAPLARAMARVGRWPLVARLERAITRLPPLLALSLFLVPVVLLLPVKFGAVWLLARGRWCLGALLLVAAKLASTGVVARIFILTRPQLMALRWFARAYRRWVVWEGRIVRRLRASLAWRLARVARRRVRMFARSRR